MSLDLTTINPKKPRRKPLAQRPPKEPAKTMAAKFICMLD
jgi:hypothetical protein